MRKIYLLPLLISFSLTALGDGSVMPMKVPEKVQAECASCHMIYPPAFLPRESWKNIMKGLDKHYGTDASLDPESIRIISQWLDQYAGTYKRVSTAPHNDRITESAWFIRKHRKITDTTWNNPKVKSKSNCMACHTTADTGNYDDDAVKVPR